MSNATTRILTGARVIDPASGLDGPAEIAIEGDRIAAVGCELAARYPGAEVIDLSGHIVTPGLIDLHTHVMHGLGDFCVHPDDAGVRTGVTTVVDAGTSSASIIGMVRRGIIDNPDIATRVLAMMDPCKIYIATSDFVAHHLEIANDLRNLDVDLAKAMVEEHGEIIVGFKVRACVAKDGDPETSPFLDAAQEIAGERPVMIHFGGFPYTKVMPPLNLVRQLRGGDIITHAFRAGSGILDANNEPVQDFVDAAERGVVLDVGHSKGDFHIPTARHLFALGYPPTTISSDLNAFNIGGPVYNLTETMSKIWALGIGLPDVIAMVTTHTAKVIHRSETLGALAPGREADITCLTVEEGEFVLDDGYEQMVSHRLLVAEGCWRAGQWFPAERRGAALPMQAAS